MQDQPEVQPTFAVQHHNPYAQQPQPQAQGYQPPAQYGGPQPPVIVVDGGQQADVMIDHVAIKQIDQHLSSGCYSCYNCWLFIIALSGLLSMLSTFGGLQNIVQFLYGATAFLYATNMMDAMSDKDAKKASKGVCYAFFVIIFNCLALYVRSVYLEYHGGQELVQIYQIAIGPAFCIDLLIILMPAIKVKGHLDRRAVLLRGTCTA